MGSICLPAVARQTCNTITLNGKTYQVGKTYGTPVVTRADDTGGFDIITDPQGTTRLYTKQSYGTAVWMDEMHMYEDSFPATIVWGNNNDVYVQDIISTQSTENYVKGTMEGNLITFDAGQVVEYVEEDPYFYGIAVGIARTEVNEEEDTVDFYFDPDVTKYWMTVDKNGNLELVLPGEPFNGEDPTEYVLCYYYTDDLQFFGFSDFYQSYKLENYQMVTMPEGVEPEQYVYIDDFDYASFVQVAFTDDYIYIQGLNPMMPEGVVRAKIDGNTASIAQNEYMGSYMGIFYIFTKVWIDNPDYNEKDPRSKPYILAPASQNFNLTFDREAGTITADTPGVYLSFQPDEDSYDNAICFLTEFILRYQATSEGTPANPTHLEYKTNWVSYQGYADLQFYLSNYSRDGFVLDADHLYYRVIANGEPIIFGEQTVVNLLGESVTAYPGVPEKQMWLPYLYSNNEDVFKVFSSVFDIGIYVWDVTQIGVQSMYYYNDVYTYSDIVTLDVKTGEITTTPAGVDSVKSDEVKSVEYFNLSGMKVENPSHGIFIKKTTYSDGNVISTKQLIP